MFLLVNETRHQQEPINPVRPANQFDERKIGGWRMPKTHNMPLVQPANETHV